MPIFIFKEVNIFKKYTACVYSSVPAGNGSCKTVREQQKGNWEEIFSKTASVCCRTVHCRVFSFPVGRNEKK